jgi:hypothetical protein
MATSQRSLCGRLVVVLGAVLGISSVTQGDVIEFGSDTTWIVSDSAHVPIGNAQFVVLNDMFPVDRPGGATDYGFPGAGWIADLSGIPGGFWIWAPGITGATPDASLAEYFFTHVFDLAGVPVSGMISIGADDFAEVIVNGVSVGTVGSVTDVLLAVDA